MKSITPRCIGRRPSSGNWAGRLYDVAYPWCRLRSRTSRDTFMSSAGELKKSPGDEDFIGENQNPLVTVK